MERIFKTSKKIDPKEALKALELAEKENEHTVCGIEKEFAFINAADLKPVQKIGRHSACKFVMKYGSFPLAWKDNIKPEVFDYMVEVITEPHMFCEQAVREIYFQEIILWQALEHIKSEFPQMSEILLSSGTLFRPACIESENIPELWDADKKTYLEQMVRRYGHRLTPQGMHGNFSIPEPLIAYQYHRLDKRRLKGSVGYIEFKNELYVHLACKLRAFVSLIIAVEANTPFDWKITNGKDITVLSGYNSTRWATLPQIESTNYPDMLKDYTHFQKISSKLIESGVIIGANNYMPIRPKGERRLGEVAVSLERTAWFYGIKLGPDEIEAEPLLGFLKDIEHLPFITKLKLADEKGWLKKKGFKFDDIIKMWQKENVQRLLGVPLNRVEIRCEESGGDYEFEIAKVAFLETLIIYLFCNPEYGAAFTYSKEDLERVARNEKNATKYGLNCQIIHPFKKRRITMREFLRQTLHQIEYLAREIGLYKYLWPLYELAQGADNEAVKKIKQVLKKLGKNPPLTKNGLVIVPKDLIRSMLIARRNYLLKEAVKNLEFENKLKSGEQSTLAHYGPPLDNVLNNQKEENYAAK